MPKTQSQLMRLCTSTLAMVARDETKWRGLTDDKTEMSYLFGINEDAVMDALHYSTKKSSLITKETPQNRVSMCLVSMS